MSDATCAHCGTAIVDRSTVAEREGQTYCCPNCAGLAASDGRVGPGANATRCAHCQRPIVDRSTLVQREAQSFCCNNCATAMAAMAGRNIGGQTTLTC